MGAHIDILFDGPPAQQMPRLIEVEDAHGRSINVGKWIERADGRWVRRPRCHVRVRCESPRNYPSSHG
jgi:hypothetical protein